MSESEHLFRDEGGAAVERAVRLEEENAQLRAQLVHERSARQAQTVRTVRQGSPALVIALVAGGLVVGLAAIGAAIALVFLRGPSPAPVALPQAPHYAPSPLTADPPAELAFDRRAAAAALGSVDIHDCKTADAPSGSGHVKVTFATSGRVLTAEVDAPPFQGTPAGECIASRYQLVQIPPFGGSSVAVGKSFTLD